MRRLFLGIFCCFLFFGAMPALAQEQGLEGASSEIESPCVPDASALESYAGDGSLLERQAFFESLDLDKTDPGLIAQAKAREDGGNNLRSVPPAWKSGMATTGDAKILLIRVDFPDYAFEPEDTEEALRSIAFGSDTEKAPYESLTSYYKRSSYGKLHLSGQVASYTAKHKRDTYTKNITDLYKEAMTALKAEGMDFSQFDGNSDGLMDGVYIHFAGKNDGWGSKWWSYKNNYNGDAFTLDGLSFSGYVLLHHNSATTDGAHTLIHETGHMLGLADYYSYTAQSYENGIRTYDMMNDNLGDHNGFSKWLLDWLEPEDIARVTGDDAETHLTLSPMSADGGSKIALVSPKDSGMFSEYFLIQYDVPGLNNNDIRASYPNIADPGFRIFHINATLDETGYNFRYQNSTPDVPKLIESVGPENQKFPGEPLYYTDGMSLTPATTPDSSFFGGPYSAYTGAHFENFNTQNASLRVRFEHNPPVVPDLVLSLKGPADSQSNLPSFSFEGNIPFSLNTSSGAREPVRLEGPDGQAFAMNCSIKDLEATVALAADTNIPTLAPNTDYTLVFPAGTFSLGQGISSKELRFPVQTGGLAAIAAFGTLDAPALDSHKKTELISRDNGSLYRFDARFKSEGEMTQDYFDQITLRVTGTDLKTKELPLTGLTNPERYSDIRGYATQSGLALALYNKNVGLTDVYAVSEQGQVRSGPFSLEGAPELFAQGDSLKAWKTDYSPEADRPAVNMTTVDFKTEPESFMIIGNSYTSSFHVFPADSGHYAVEEHALLPDWSHRTYLSLYSADAEKASWQTNLEGIQSTVGVSLQKGSLLLFQTNELETSVGVSSSNSKWRNLAVTILDSKGTILQKAKPLGPIRTLHDSVKISVKSGPSAIAIESLFTVPALPLSGGANPTDCLDYRFVDPQSMAVKALTGRNLYAGAFQGDRYLMAGLNISDGSTTYHQTEPLFPSTPPDPVKPDDPVAPNPPQDSGHTAAKAQNTAAATGITDNRKGGAAAALCLSGILLVLTLCQKRQKNND